MPFVRKPDTVLRRHPNYESPSKTTAKVIVAAGLCFVAFRVVAWKMPVIRRIARRLFSRQIAENNTVDSEGTGGCVRVEPTTVRQVFGDTPVVRPNKVKFHTHGDSAADRSTAAPFARSLAQNLGMEPFMIQMSKSDQRRGFRGSRDFHWAKDVTVSPSDDSPDGQSLIVAVDTDYYLDMNEQLLDNVRPWLLYTTLPRAVADPKDNDASFTFNDDNEIVVKVCGGAEYKHELWNYNVDSLKITQKFFGIPIKVVTYAVDRRSTSKHHGFVLLTPTGSWSRLSALFAWLVLEGSRLKRLRVACAGFLRLRVQGPGGAEVSTGIVNGYNAVTISAVLDDALAAYARTTKTTINAPGVRSYFPELSKPEAMALMEYHRAMGPDIADTVYPVERGIRRYQFTLKEYDVDAKRSLTPYMSPLLPECFAPDQTLANEERAVLARVTKVASRVESTLQHHLFMTEFIELLIPEEHKGKGIPREVEEVYERQNKPSQQRILDEACDLGPFYQFLSHVKSFIKKEAYGKPNDPRIISTINAVDKLGYSRYIYAFSAYLKTQSWYAFGKKPVEIAQRIALLCESCENTAMNSDLSRFDGRVSPVLRDLERKILLRFFKPEFSWEVLALHRSQFNQKGFTTLGVKYDTNFSRLSGSPETSSFNSIASAFIAYIAFRMGYRGRRLTPAEAYAKLGLYGGDDGFTVDIEQYAYVCAAESVGQVLTVSEIEKGSFGVTFLARYYSPEVWYGCVDSMCDIKRQLSKFHTTPNLSQRCTPQEKLLEKSRSYYLSDRNTPVLGELVKRVLHYSDEKEPDGLADPLGNNQILRSWCSRVSNESQYPNEYGDWMLRYLELHIPGFDYVRFLRAIAEANSLEDLMKLPICMEPKRPNPNIQVIVDDEVVEPSDDDKHDIDPHQRRNTESEVPAHLKLIIGRNRIDSVSSMSSVPHHKRSPVCYSFQNSGICAFERRHRGVKCRFVHMRKQRQGPHRGGEIRRRGRPPLRGRNRRHS
jgi:hypothetical protein